MAGPGGLQITVGSFEGGLALDADRRPVLVLAALDAVVGATGYGRLDLTDGDALAGAVAQAVVDAAGTLLDLLGPLGDAVGALIGLTDPPGGPAPRVDPAALLGDPIGAVRDRWLALLAGPADTVRSVLAVWQEATASATRRAVPVTGDGSVATPYRVAVTDGVDLLLTRTDGAAAAASSASRSRRAWPSRSRWARGPRPTSGSGCCGRTSPRRRPGSGPGLSQSWHWRARTGRR